MNWVASCTITVGKKGLELLKEQPEALKELVEWEAEGEVVAGDYVRLHLPGCPEGRVWATARELEAFVMEESRAWGGAFLEGRWQTYEVMPFCLQSLAEVYKQWEAHHPPFEDAEEALEAIEAILEAHKEDEDALRDHAERRLQRRGARNGAQEMGDA